MRLGEWCQIKWPYPLCPRVQGDVDTSAHLGNPLVCVPLLCKRPALKKRDVASASGCGPGTEIVEIFLSQLLDCCSRSRE